jgi:predicted outer membrane repeat protein
MEFSAANAEELIAAIRAANDAPDEGHTIYLTGQDTDYMLFDLVEEWFGGNGLPVITSDITIHGNGRLITRSIDAPSFRFFMVNGRNEHTRARLILNDLTLANGDTVGMGGGAIVNDGVLIVNNCIFRENRGTLGGAIYAGDLSPTTIIGSVFIYNLATQQGGAVYGANTCQLQVNASLFYENLSPSGASHIYESVAGTTQIEDCFKWDGAAFTQIDNIPETAGTTPSDAEQTLLRHALSDTQRIHNLRADAGQRKPARRYGTPLPPDPWWRDDVPAPTFGSLISEAEATHSVPALSIESLIYSGQFQTVRDLAVAVSAQENALREKMELMSKTFNHIQISLAYRPGVASIETLLYLARFDNRQQAAGVAAWTASFQSKDTVIAFFDRNGKIFQAIMQELRGKHVISNQLEFLVALTQEMVLRGLDGESVLSIKNLIQNLRESYLYVGSLIRLPLVHLELEENLISPLRDGRFPDPPGEHFDTFDAEMPTIRDLPLPPFKEITPYDSDKTIGAAIAFFDVEARVYQFEAPLAPDEITTSLMLSLDLKLIQHTNRMGIKHIEPEAALEHLSHYDNDHRTEPNTPAYRRLKIWTSIAGLVGAKDMDKLELLQDVARACHWFYFRTDFGYIGNDSKALGLAVLRPDGHTLAVLVSLVPEDY